VRETSAYHQKNTTPLRLFIAIFSLALILGLAACCGPIPPPPANEGETHVEGEAVTDWTYEVVAEYPHDPGAFTQGFFYADGLFYEGTGLNGRSSLRKIEPASGLILDQVNLERKYFGEGIALAGQRIIQLTWRSETGFVYDKDNFVLLGTFSYPGEGWGITYDGARLIVSDGTATLRFWDPETFAETGRVTVRDQGQAVRNLNELEYIQGEVFANVWQTEKIVRIDPASGEVTGWIHLEGLRNRLGNAKGAEVLNGIAYDPAGDRLFVTGKLWPKVFEIRLIPRP
jgi:glutaminyl-peptide cyclotransferase